MTSCKIALNALLLSQRAGYRSAGIHGYLDGLLRHLPAHLPDGWSLTALVGGANASRYDDMPMRRASLFGRPFDTESPMRRILWEQVAQPFALGGFDLLHAGAFVAPLWLRQPCVVTIYDLSFIHHPGRLPAARRLYLRGFTGLTVRRARRVIAISHSTARDLTQTLGVPASRIDVAAPGTDHAVMRPLPADQVAAFRQRKNLPARFWLFLGTLEPRKNLPLLLEAYAALPESHRLPLILGGGKGWDYEPIFAAVERLRLTDSVTFPGFIPSDELPFWYNSAHAFIYPSVFEGFGLPVLEAMACGTPVIVSDASSLPEVAGDAGLCISLDDAAAWTAALRRASQDAAWRETARERGFAAAARYTWNHTARETVNSYQRAIANRLLG
jgi:glycosyltransferase involved in cell wall biosynthesis